MKLQKLLLKEAITEYKIYMIDDTFWVAYGQGSGTTTEIRNIKSFFTSKSDDSHFDSIVRQVVKASKTITPLKTKGGAQMFEVPVYPFEGNSRTLDIWAKEHQREDDLIKPAKKKKYLVLTVESDYHLVNLFNTKKEATYWVSNVSTKIDESI